MTVDPTMLEAAVRSHLNIIAPRTMVVLDKLKVNLINFDGPEKSVSVPDFPESPEKSSHFVTFNRYFKLIFQKALTKNISHLQRHIHRKVRL